MKLQIIAAIVCMSSLAFAQAKTEKPAAAPAMQMPKPAAELDNLLKGKVGNWKCDVSVPESPMGPAHTFKSKIAISKSAELGGFWYSGKYEEIKSKEHPMDFKAQDFWGYDTANKKWVRMWVDNMGGWSNFTGALEGNKLTWTGEGMMMGKKTPIRHTIEMISDKEMHDKFEIQMNAKWLSLGEGVCKK